MSRENRMLIMIDTPTCKLLVDLSRLFHLNSRFTAPFRNINDEIIHAEQKYGGLYVDIFSQSNKLIKIIE